MLPHPELMVHSYKLGWGVVGKTNGGREREETERKRDYKGEVGNGLRRRKLRSLFC